MKSLLSKCLSTGENFQVALATWRQIPRADGFSPAEMFFCRCPRGILPTIRPEYTDIPEATEARLQTQSNSKSLHDLHATTLQPLVIGQRVYFKDKDQFDRQGRIISMRESGSYHIQTDDGSTFLRNRRLIRPQKELSTEDEPSVAQEPFPATDQVR